MEVVLGDPEDHVLGLGRSELAARAARGRKQGELVILLSRVSLGAVVCGAISDAVRRVVVDTNVLIAGLRGRGPAGAVIDAWVELLAFLREKSP